MTEEKEKWDMEDCENEEETVKEKRRKQQR